MKRHRILVVSLAILTLSGVVSSQGNSAAEARLRMAMDKETIDGDLDDAIRQYAALAADHKAPERVRGEALLRLAMAHEKSGSTEARVYYERAVGEFPRLTDVVRIASSRLAGRGAQVAAGRTTRLLCAGSDCLAKVSPDGRSLLVYGRGNTGVFVKDVRSGAIRRIAGAPEDAQGLSWSPDGKQIAYGTKNGATGIVAMSGGLGRTLHPNSYPETWSPDGKRVLVVLRPPERPGEEQLAWVSVADGSVRQLPPKVALFLGVVVSPDGKWLAYGAAQSLVPFNQTGINFMASEGSGDVSTWPYDDGDLPVGWTPDGKYFLWSGRDSIWVSRFSDGRLQGSPQLIIREPGISAVQLTRAGSLIYRKQVSDIDFYIAPLDPRSGRVTAAPTLLPGAGPNNYMARYSPDGRRLVYFDGADRQSFRTMKVFSFDSQEEQVLRTTNPMAGGPVCWLDNDAIAFNSPRQGGAGGVVSMNLRTQEERLLPSQSAFAIFSCAGGLGSGISDGGVGVSIRTLADGSERELYRYPAPVQPPLATPALSRDGMMLAFFERILPRTFVLRVVPTNGGDARELARFEQPVRQNQPRCITWSPDGRYVYYCRSDSNDVVETFRVPVTGGASTSTGLKGPGAGDIEISPDGTRIISRWGVPGERRLWALDNFLPSEN
jgi:Tol biopolymer transport system component